MGKLYILAIGGTGSRVLRSLVYLLASGVDIDASEVVPVIIDPDHGAGDLTRTVSLIRAYNELASKIEAGEGEKGRFFKTHINTKIVRSLALGLERTRDVAYRDYIGYADMEREVGLGNLALTSAIFSQHNLDATMEVGFKGNPNIGSVVLNQFGDSMDFRTLCDSFNEGDRIFIVSSIFGGTGASGFPLLTKLLRSLPESYGKRSIVQNAPIGALSVLPYFQLKSDEESEIDSSTFIGKTQAALSYYYRNLKNLNCLYYVSDSTQNQYENCEGGEHQQNDAHLVEFVGALAIRDFMSLSDETLRTENGMPFDQYFKEFGLEGEAADLAFVNFGNLGTALKSSIAPAMTRFLLFARYVEENMEAGRKTQWARDAGFDEPFFTQDFYRKLEKFLQSYEGWLAEMAGNRRSFRPFRLEARGKEIFNIVQGIEPKRDSLFANKGFNYIDAKLIGVKKKATLGSKGMEARFVELFAQALDEVVKEKLSL